MTDETICLIWSNEHRAWWAPGRMGYTKTLDKAGRYSLAEAISICAGAIPTAHNVGAIAEIPVRLADVDAFLLRYPHTIPKEISGRGD